MYQLYYCFFLSFFLLMQENIYTTQSTTLYICHGTEKHHKEYALWNRKLLKDSWDCERDSPSKMCSSTTTSTVYSLRRCCVLCFLFGCMCLCLCFAFVSNGWATEQCLRQSDVIQLTRKVNAMFQGICFIRILYNSTFSRIASLIKTINVCNECCSIERLHFTFFFQRSCKSISSHLHLISKRFFLPSSLDDKWYWCVILYTCFLYWTLLFLSPQRIANNQFIHKSFIY